MAPLGTIPPPNGILPASSRARARHPNALATIERISAARCEYPTSLPHAAAIRNAMRTWLAVRNAVSEANSPNAQGSSPRFGTRLGSAVATANTAFSRDTALVMRSTTRQRQFQIVVVVQDFRDGGRGVVKSEEVSVLGARDSLLVQDHVNLARRSR